MIFLFYFLQSTRAWTGNANSSELDRRLQDFASFSSLEVHHYSISGGRGGQVCTGLYCSSPHGTVSNTLSLRWVQLLLPNKILMMKGNVNKKCIAMFDSILSHPFFDFEKKIFPFREKYQYSQLVQLCFCRKKPLSKTVENSSDGGGGHREPFVSTFPFEKRSMHDKIGRKNVLMPRQNMGCDKKWGQKLSDGFFIDGSFHH